jgi:ribonuclease R
MGKGRKENKSPLGELISSEILGAFNRFPHKTFNYKQLAKIAGLKDKEDKQSVIEVLESLKEKGTVIETERGKYKLKPLHSYATGIIEISSTGAAYVVSDSFEEDIYIAPKNVKTALNGDKVKIYLYAKRRDRRIEGEVIEVLERAKTQFVGIVQVSSKFAFLVPDSHKMLVDVFIPLPSLNGAENGQKAIAEITEWPKGSRNPVGKIIKVLGWPGDNNTEMDAILVEYGFPTEFPAEVEEEAREIPAVIPPKEIKKRRDFRNITTFTIDPVDAKDFDDALSIRALDNGNWEIGVHIADVSYYVREGSLLDKEAYERATSIYLVDRVIPMLPEKLSNQVCSLRPHEDKLCYSAVFEMTDGAKLVGEWFGRTIINSSRRFTYEEAQEIIETGKGDLAREILTFDRLAKILRKDRFKMGAIAFEKTEVKFRLDEKGNPLGVYLKENKDSNKLIEEFMLLANRRVAEFIGKKKEGELPKTFVYRIHDVPVADKLANFASFAGKFGYKLNLAGDRNISDSLNKLMKDLAGKKEQNVLEQLAIRTMAKAVYTTENIGHYGLAFDYYSHFTSPIRRYPDVIAHRLLEHYLNGGKSVDAEEIEKQCEHSTEMEIKASEAERASIKYKQVQFLQNKIGELFEGIISGITEWGIYVELTENKCEGMIRLRDIEDDFYEFDEANFCVTGMRTGKKFQLGDNVQVRLKRTDLVKKQIDFELVKDSSLSFEDEFGFGEGSTRRRHSPGREKTKGEKTGSREQGGRKTNSYRNREKPQKKRKR